MKVNIVKATGLVPVVLLRASLPYRSGAIAGFYPAAAVQMVKDGDARFAEIPEGVETEELTFGDPAHEPAAPVTDLGEVAPIPDDWATMHHMTRLKLARTFNPDAKTDAEAIAAIEAEIARRADASPSTDNA